MPGLDSKAVGGVGDKGTAMDRVPAHALTFRCYLRPDPHHPGSFVAHCIDLDLWATGKSPADAQRSLGDAIEGYLETVLDTEDQGSIPRLLRRKSPIRYRLFWRLAFAMERLTRRPPNSRPHPYEYTQPFHLGRTPA